MAKGSVAKEAITNQILKNFNGSFIYGKEIRIPFDENGVPVQIKVTLTCAKENVEEGVDAIAPFAPIANGVTEITSAEKAEVDNLIAKLGL